MATDARAGSTNAPNRDRGMPTGAFTVRPRHLEAIRDAARRRGVSQSEIVREALDQLFPDDTGAEDGRASRRRPITLPVSRAVRDLAALRGEVTDLRRLMERLGGIPVLPVPQEHADGNQSDESVVHDLAALRREVDDLRQIAWQTAMRPSAMSAGDVVGETSGE